MPTSEVFYTAMLLSITGNIIHRPRLNSIPSYGSATSSTLGKTSAKFSIGLTKHSFNLIALFTFHLLLKLCYLIRSKILEKNNILM